MLPYDPSRQDATRVQKLGMPNYPHVTSADQDDVSNLDETALRTLRRQRIIGAIVVVVIMALIAAYLILGPRLFGG